MATINDFDNFYASDLLPSLKRLQKEKQQPKYWMWFGILCVPLIITIAINFNDIGSSLATVLIVFFVLSIFASVYFYSKVTDTFVDDYKASIIKEIIKYVNPNYTYLSDKSITRTDYITSSLYRYGYDSFDGDDYIEGIYNNVSFRCSEIQTQADYKGGRGGALVTGSGPDRSRWFQGMDPVIFTGFFFVATTSKIAGCTYIWENGFAQLPINMNDEHYGGLLPMPEVSNVDFTDTDFQQNFKVYSNYAPEAEQILTDERRANMVKLRQLLNKKIRVSFVQGFCYVAVEFYGDLFEPFSSNVADKKEIDQYFQTLNLIPAIVDYLKLNEL
jgi:hypothetical protein